MSCSLWRWTPECDGRFCAGDCDLCSFNDEDEEDEVYTVTEPTVSLKGGENERL